MKELTIDSKELELYWFTGKVAGSSKNLETTVSVSGGGGGGYVQGGTGYVAPVSISSSSTTTVHDQLFLIDRNGKEKSFQLQDFDIACRETHQVTVLWAMNKGAKEGPYVLVYNHTTKDAAFKEEALSRLLKPSKLPYWIGSLAAIFLSIYLSLKVFSFGVGSFFLLSAIVAPIGGYASKTNARVKQLMSSINYEDLLA
jgi:hypothetical protein